jgi:hypothetical protein
MNNTKAMIATIVKKFFKGFASLAAEGFDLVL